MQHDRCMWLSCSPAIAVIGIIGIGIGIVIGSAIIVMDAAAITAVATNVADADVAAVGAR